MNLITRYQKLNELLRKLPRQRLEVSGETATKHYPKTCAAFAQAAHKAGWQGNPPTFVFDAGTFSLTGLVYDNYYNVWSQSKPGGESLVSVTKNIDVNDFATIQTNRIETQAKAEAEKVKLFDFELTDEFIEVAYVAAKNLYAEQIKKEILQKLVEDRLKEEGYV
jgi:hypothetical protein